MNTVFFLFTAFLLSLIGCRMAIPLLQRWRVMDTPNARSNHSAPVPRGGGIVVMATIYGLAFYGHAIGDHFVFLPAILLAVVFMWEDVFGLPVIVRLGAQVLAFFSAAWPVLGMALYSCLLCSSSATVNIDFPLLGLLLLALIVWVLAINFYNFMDGINGITAMQTCSICVGMLLLGKPFNLAMPVIIMGALLGFYWWNRTPARLFIGDSGSVPLGGLMVALLVEPVLRGRIGYFGLLPLLILPLYYWLDATSTLVWRTLKGEKPWQAHSEHAYQWAVRSGYSHAQVTLRILLLNLLLIALAWGATQGKVAAFACTIAAFCATSALILHFRRRYLRMRLH